MNVTNITSINHTAHPVRRGGEERERDIQKEREREGGREGIITITASPRQQIGKTLADSPRMLGSPHLV